MIAKLLFAKFYKLVVFLKNMTVQYARLLIASIVTNLKKNIVFGANEVSKKSITTKSSKKTLELLNNFWLIKSK